ncbi:NAD(P)H-dependent glycerol-3-phosphate dehydrogenase [Gemella cuniculi]|uniref:NAD(P)H-dependent glycerol-3-phosphate dehydrogenase n=1 Tax=Gemella cuniculi TaxID=150240 RepID=UPI000418DA96|nr:NAD(P)H-dependent glycerol-3-phosphate dehydrogenase [Gemella cuniculi]
MKVSVIGAGSWGTALSQAIVDNDHELLLYARSEKVRNEINEEHTNRRYLKNIVLPKEIIATCDLKRVVNFSDVLVIAVPTKAMRETVRIINEYIDKPKYIIHVSKGLEMETNKRMSEIIEDEINTKYLKGVGVLSGPSHAEELILRNPTVVAIASKNDDLNKVAQKIFHNKYFRIYVNKDIIGVEVGGALKNIIALGCGIIDGMEYGDNAKAALLTRGLIEITRLGTKLGADKMTFLGLGGIGDLVVTCTSKHSRNYNCGYLIGKGYTLEEAVKELDMVAEGVRTTKVCYFLSKKYNVYMPITENIYKVLYEDLNIEECVENLMKKMAAEEINKFE